MKRIIGRLSKERSEYYLYLVRECMSSLSRAEDYYSMHMFPSSDRMLFHSAELFWKSLIILSDHVFDWKHEPPSDEFSKISTDILSDREKAELYKLVAQLPEARRQFAIYGYVEKGRKTAVAPNITQQDVDQDLRIVVRLVETLRRIHLFQVSEPPVRVGILSGYVDNLTKETPCSSYPYSGFKKASEWVDDLRTLSTDKGPLFAPEQIPVSALGSWSYPMVVNPFGECIPEKGVGRGIALRTILEYVRDGGILVNSAGHPFIYGWNVDVPSNNRQLLVSYAAMTTAQIKLDERGKLQIIPAPGAIFPGDALVLTAEFGVRCVWDLPTMVGPQEIEVTYSERLHPLISGKAKVFRPIVPDRGGHTIPLASAETQAWGSVYPVAAIPYGRGFLISLGLSLDGEREYWMALEMIKTLATKGLDTLLSH